MGICQAIFYTECTKKNCNAYPKLGRRSANLKRAPMGIRGDDTPPSLRVSLVDNDYRIGPSSRLDTKDTNHLSRSRHFNDWLTSMSVPVALRSSKFICFPHPVTEVYQVLTCPYSTKLTKAISIYVCVNISANSRYHLLLVLQYMSLSLSLLVQVLNTFMTAYT